MNQQTQPARTRREFVTGGAAAVAGAGLARAASASLALNGGARAITIPAARIAAITKWPRYSAAEKNTVAELLDNNNWYAEIPALEREMKAFFDVPYAKAHMNGTSALMSTFFALDLPAGSEILAPSYTAWATTAPMFSYGYVPRFVDINPRSMTFDLDYARKCLTPRTRAILPMHSFGNPCDMDQIADFAREKGLILLEDAAQALGASLKGKRVGTWGAIGIFSFQSSKVLPAIEGGAALYQSREHYERAATYGGYELPAGFPADSPYKRYMGTGFGPKLRIHALAAAIARHQFRSVDAHNDLIHAQLAKLNARLTALPGISIPYTRPDAKRVYWGSNLIFLDEKKAGAPRERLMKALAAEGVTITPGRYDEQHRYALYSETKWWHHPVVIPDDLHGTTEVNRLAARLPVFHAAAEELLEQYAQAFEKVWANRAALA
jgi:dTDP-4-amino-4,6-dideoxygalactose transaminase